MYVAGCNLRSNNIIIHSQGCCVLVEIVRQLVTPLVSISARSGVLTEKLESFKVVKISFNMSFRGGHFIPFRSSNSKVSGLSIFQPYNQSEDVPAPRSPIHSRSLVCPRRKYNTLGSSTRRAVNEKRSCNVLRSLLRADTIGLSLEARNVMGRCVSRESGIDDT